MPITLGPGVIIKVMKTGNDLYDPTTSSSFKMKATPRGTSHAVITIQFEVESEIFIPAQGKTYTDAQWAALKDKIIYFGFKHGSTSDVDSSANLQFHIKDVDSSDKKVEVTPYYEIVNAKVGGAG